MKDKSYVETVSYIQEKVKNDISGQVLKELNPMQDKLRKYIKSNSMAQTEKVELRY